MPLRADEVTREEDRANCIREFGFDPRTERHPDAPRTRADCENGPRPCPFVGCRNHLWFDIGTRGNKLFGRRSHVVKWHFNGIYEDPTEMPERASCTLDLADDHAKTGMTLGEIGKVWQLHSERVRQIEVSALRKVRRAFKKFGIDASWLAALAVEVPESMFAQAMTRSAQVATEISLDVESPEEPPSAAARILAIPRNGHSKPPILALPRAMPTPTPIARTTMAVRSGPLFLR